VGRRSNRRCREKLLINVAIDTGLKTCSENRDVTSSAKQQVADRETPSIRALLHLIGFRATPYDVGPSNEVSLERRGSLGRGWGLAAYFY